MGKSNWSEEQVEKLRQLWDEGLSASEVAAELGVSRSCVSGKARRIGIMPRSPSVMEAQRQRGLLHRFNSTRKPRVRKLRAASHTLGLNLTRLERIEKLRDVPMEKPRPIPSEAPRPTMQKVDELTPRQCRYIYGDVKHGEYGYCGAEAELSLQGPWCPYHYAQVYQVGTHRR